MLFRLRHELNPMDRDGISEQEVIARRKEDAELAKKPIARFAMLYRPHYYWAEVRLVAFCFVERRASAKRCRE